MVGFSRLINYILHLYNMGGYAKNRHVQHERHILYVHP